MNEYRLHHRGNLVRMEQRYTRLAESYLNLILTTSKTHIDRRILRYYVEIPYYFAPLIIKTWYDESKFYRYGTSVSITGTEHFTTIVWRSVKYVGFAVQEINDMIHFVAVFEPEPSGHYRSAVAYAHLINFRLKFCCGQNEYHEIPHELNILKKVGRCGFSNRIWRNFLNEINEYRLRHRAGIVKIKSEYTKLAEKYLNTILKTPKKYLNLRLLRNYVGIPFYFAPLIIKNWYDERKKYKYGTKVAIAGTEHFTAIVWRNVKHVGFAVQEKDDTIHFLAVFGPEPNGPKLFSSNVKGRSYFSSSRFLVKT
uniref:SCP domain-containing protein n=1 Tax=Strongyloides papillosus TaxID=174720 RepID=A0A0N5BQH4_STREA